MDPRFDSFPSIVSALVTIRGLTGRKLDVGLGLPVEERCLQEAGSIPRYLGLDVGSKRIGVAVSDELGLTAQPVRTLIRKRNPKDDLRSLARLCRKFGCAGIVVGNPLHMSGEPSEQAAKTQIFANELALMTGLPLYLWDERLTSREAHAILYAAGKSREEHKPLVDQVAATLILQSFLDAPSENV